MSQIFSYQSRQIRTVTENNETWFAAIDVCRALDISWSGSKILKGFPPDWQRIVKLTTLRRGEQETVVISEPAVYKLAFRSNKPEADAFTNWVASEVLPAIRQTGKYEAAPKPKALPEPEPKTKRGRKSLPEIDPVERQLDTLLEKARFFIREVSEVEKQVDAILLAERSRNHQGQYSTDCPADRLYLNMSCSQRTLWASLDFGLKAVEENVKAVLAVARM